VFVGVSVLDGVGVFVGVSVLDGVGVFVGVGVWVGVFDDVDVFVGVCVGVGVGVTAISPSFTGSKPSTPSPKILKNKPASHGYSAVVDSDSQAAKS
jgi:hypothetical protein